MQAIAVALNDLLWASFSFRNLIKGEARVKFLDVWNGAAKALSRSVYNVDEEVLQHPRDAAMRLHRRCLEVCAALGVKPHELTPQFNERVDGGFLPHGEAADHVTLLGLEATRVARALIAPKQATRTGEEAHHVAHA